MLHFTGNKQTVLKTKNKQTQKTNHKQYKMKKAKTKQIAPECFVFVSFSFLFGFFFAFFSKEKCRFGIPESPEEKKETKKKQIQSILAQFVSFLFFHFVFCCGLFFVVYRKHTYLKFPNECMSFGVLSI